MTHYYVCKVPLPILYPHFYIQVQCTCPNKNSNVTEFEGMLTKLYVSQIYPVSLLLTLVIYLHYTTDLHMDIFQTEFLF